MNLDENTKWIIEKAVVVVVAMIGVLGSGKLLSSKAEAPAQAPGDWEQLVGEQRAVLADLKERLDELEDAAKRKDRFIIQLLRDCQAYQRTINDLERALNRPLTQWEITLTDEAAPVSAA